jgi:branched-chain amino acid transport system substrate-binding protein
VAATRKVGWNVEFLGQAAAYDEAVAAAPGGLTEGVYAMTPILFAQPDDPRPAVHDFVTKYKAAFGREPNFAAQIGYSAAQIVVLGLKNAGRDLTVDSYVKGMESIKDYHDAFGSPAMTFSDTKHQGSSQSFLCMVKDGRWVPISTTPYSY